VLIFERSLGMSVGHTEILKFLEDQIRAIEGDEADSPVPD
jgi:hypothetical protein